LSGREKKENIYNILAPGPFQLPQEDQLEKEQNGRAAYRKGENRRFI
jgi:hypothetical protein